jgi:hypothetical protein
VSFDSSIGSGASSLILYEIFLSEKRLETTEKIALGSCKKEGNTHDGEVHLLWHRNTVRGVFLLELWQQPAFRNSLIEAASADHG